MKGIVDWSLRQRVLINLGFILLIILGLVVVSGLPVDSWPEVSLDEAWISTYWDGAGAEEVERLITSKIEEEIADIAGIKRLVSTSQPGRSFIDVKFDEDLAPQKLEAAFSDLRTALDRVEDLPLSAESPILRRLTTSEVWPLFSVVISAREPDFPEIVLRETAVELKKVLEEVPGVLKIRYQSYRDRELRVFVDRLKARRFGIGLTEIHAALGRTNRSHPAGSLSEAGAEMEDEIRLKFDTEYSRPEDIENAVIRTLPGQEPIRIRDVARVKFDFEKVRMKSRINSQKAVVLNLAKDTKSNTIVLRRNCGEAIDAFSETAPEGVEFAIVGDQSEVVESRFRILIENLLQGVVIVSFILLFTLGLRNALIALIGIPFSYLCAIMLFPTLGMSLNNLTLFGMVLVGGMLVDDAIIVIENIYRYVEKGGPFLDAVRRGASEVAWPVFNACLTSIAAMLPLLLQGGVTGRFFAYIPKVVILALLFSVIQCVTVLPVHYFDFGSRYKKSRKRKRDLLARMRVRFFQVTGDSYQRLLCLVLRFRLAFLVVVLGASLLLVGLVLQIRQDPWVSDFSAVFVSIECDPTYNLEQTEQAAGEVESVVSKLYEEGLLKNYYTISGFKMTEDGIFVLSPNVALLMATLEDIPEVTAEPEKVVERLRTQLARFTNYRPRVFTPHDGPPLGKPVAVRVECNDYLLAKRVSEEIQAELRSLPGVSSVADNLDLGPREFRFEIDADRAAPLGLYPVDLALALRASNDGLVMGSYKDRVLDEDVDIRVQYDPADRTSPQDLLDIATPAGALVPLGDLSRVDVDRPNASYYHYDARRTVLVTADVDGVVATGPAVNEHLRKVFEDVPQRYSGVRLFYGGEFEETTKSMQQQTRSFWVALVLIYVLLATQFRSYKQPFIVMAVVPFGVLGVLLGLYVRDQPFTIPTFIAMIGLAGVVVNDSLVMVEFINLRRGEGMGRLDAIVTAARQRFRPVLLTATTTMGNLIPLAYGLGGASRVWTPFAVSIVFGMGVASLMTLFMVPVLYTLVVRR